MDANVAAALISVGGSAALAATGAAAQWVRRRKRKRTLSAVINELREHPCLSLSSESSIRIICCDDAKSDLLNALREAVLLRPVEQALSSALDGLSTHGSQLTAEDVEQAFGTVFDYIHREQLAQLNHFPTPCHDVARRLLETHRTALSPAVDLNAADFSPERLLEALFSVFYVATYSTASQWSQTANQLNGQLNGVVWKGRRLQYTFQGNVSDASRILGNVLGGMQDVLGEDCIAAMVDASGRFESVTMSSNRLLGYRPQELIGKPLSALQLGISDLPSSGNLAALETSQQGAQMETRLRRADGQNASICVHVDQVILSVPQTRICKLAVFLFAAEHRDPSPVSADGSARGTKQAQVAQDSFRRETTPETESAEAGYGNEDLHTRFALLVSALTHPTRRIMTGSFYMEADQPLVVSTVVDGAPDLPLLETGKLLHTQIGVIPRRVADACSRAGRRVQDDLLRSSTMSYAWRDVTLAAEFYLLGKPGSWAIFTIHRPHTPSSVAEGAAPALRSTRVARPRVAHYALTCLPRCSRAPAARVD